MEEVWIDAKPAADDTGWIDAPPVSAVPEKNASTAGAAWGAVKMLPRSIISSGIQAVQGQEGASVADAGFLDSFVSETNRQQEELTSKYEGTGDFIPGLISKEEVAGMGANLGFTGASMAGSIAGGALGAITPVPGATIAGGLAGGGATAYRMQGYSAMLEHLQKKNKESIATKSRPLSRQEEEQIKKDFSAEATRQGLWEAGPEAVGNVGEIAIWLAKSKIPGGKMIPPTLLNKVAGFLGRTFGTLTVEEITETITEMGQSNKDFSNIEDWKKSAKAVLGPTLLTTGIISTVGGAARRIKNKANEWIDASPTETPAESALPPEPTITSKLDARRRRAIKDDIEKKLADKDSFAASLEEEKQDAAEGNLIIQEDEIVKLQEGQPEFIDNKVTELGSIAAVDAFYKGKSEVDIYAREKARALFGEQAAVAEQPSVQNLNEGEATSGGKQPISTLDIKGRATDGGFTVEAFDKSGNVVGTATLRQQWRGVFVPDTVNVNPEYRRMGVASKLYDSMSNLLPEGSRIDFRAGDLRSEMGHAFRETYDKKRGFSGEQITTEMKTEEYIPSATDTVMAGKSPSPLPEAGVKQEPLTYDELLQLNKRGYEVLEDIPSHQGQKEERRLSTPEELEAQQTPIKKNIKAKPTEEWRRILNTNEENDKFPISEEKLAKLKALDEGIQKYASERRSRQIDVATLKEEGGFTDKQIAAMSASEIERKAGVLRGDIDPLADIMQKEAKLTELEARSRQLANEIAGKTLEELTDEQLARVEEISALTADADVKGIEHRPSVFDLIDSDTGFTKVTFEQYQKQRRILERIIRKRQEPKAKEPTKVEQRRRKRVAKVAEQVAAVETDAELSPEELKKKWNDTIGMPEEVALGDDQFLEDQQQEDLDPETRREQEFSDRKGEETKSHKELSAEAKQNFDRTMSQTRVFGNYKVARNTIVQGYKYMAENLTKAREHLAMLIRAEQMAEPHLANKRSAFDAKVIAKAVREGVISKPQAKYVETILKTLKQQPDFKLEFDATIDQLGIYELADNLMTIKNPKATAHEVMHWAFYNVLTGQERIAYYREYMNQFYNQETGNRKTLKTWAATSNPYNASKNPSEMFAARGSDVANQYKLTAVERGLFEKTITWFKGLMARLAKFGGVKLDKIDALYDKVMDDSARLPLAELDTQIYKGKYAGVAEADAFGVWHGTKAMFQKFKNEYIGSGEGAQMRGWGHYFTSKKELGEYYANQVSRFSTEYKVDNANVPFDLSMIYSGIPQLDKILNYDYTPSVKAEAIRNLKYAYQVDSPAWNALDQMASWVESGSKITINRNKVLHEVDLPDNLNLLDLDKPVSKEQATSIASALQEYIDSRGEFPDYKAKEAGLIINQLTKVDPYITGNEIQNALKAVVGSNPRRVSEFLRDKAGIQGNTYIGDTSGVQNYVIFDENIPNIIKSETLDMMGLNSLSNKIAEYLQVYRMAKVNRGTDILAEVQGRPVGIRNQVTTGQAINRNIGPLFRSPEDFAAGTINDKHTYNLNRAEQYIASMFDEHKAAITDAQLGLSEEEKANVRKVLEKKIAGNTKEQSAATKVRAWLEHMRAKYKTTLLKDWIKNLNKTEYNALIDYVSGATIEQMALKYPKLDMPTIKEIADNYKAIDEWGLDDYVPNVEKGRFKIVTTKKGDDGKTYQTLVGIGLSEGDAVRKAVAWLSLPENADATGLMIDTDFKVFQDDKTAVSRKQYYAIMNKLSKELQASVENIDAKVAKELAKKSLSRKFAIKPTHAFSEFVLPRRDVLKGEDNIFPVLEGYAYSMEKKMALDPVIDLIKKDLSKMKPAERDFILDLVEDVKGRYTKMDKIVDDIFGTYGGYSRTIGRIRTIEANIKLGYRPIAAAINFASGQLHTWVKVGTPTYIKAIQFMRTEEGRKLLKDVHRFLGTTLATGEDLKAKTELKVGPIKVKGWAAPLGLFQMAEPINREVSVTANYLYAKETLGLSEEAAKQFAIRANWAQQFTYNIANLPKIMRGPTGRLVTQFKPYLVKELEFMSNLSGKEWIRYLTMQLALGGPRGYLMIMRSLPILATLGFWEEAMDELEEWMNKNAPNLSRGVGALARVDITASATSQFPKEPLDFVGPALSDLVNLYKNVVVPMSTFGPEAEDMKKVFKPIVAAKYFGQALEYALSKDEWLKDTHGKKLYEVPSALPFIIQSIAGVRSIDLNRIKAEEQILIRRDDRFRGESTRLINKALKYILKNEEFPQDLLDKMQKYGIKADSIINRVKRSQIPPDLRMILDRDVMQRMQVIEYFNQENTFP